MSKARKIELLKQEIESYARENYERSETWWKNITLLMAEILVEEES